jgi:hypothetical protein
LWQLESNAPKRSGTLRKPPKLHGEENDFASAEKDANGSRQTRSQGCTKETGRVKVKLPDRFQNLITIRGIIALDRWRFGAALLSATFSSTFAGT